MAITKELLIKARDTLPQELCTKQYYEEQTNRYCGIGWLAHCAGIKLRSGRGQLDTFRIFEEGIQFNTFELIEANDECTWEHERYDRVKHVLNKWIEQWPNP